MSDLKELNKNDIKSINEIFDYCRQNNKAKINWGMVQNNYYDSLLDIFKINNYEEFFSELKTVLSATKTEKEKDKRERYFIKRYLTRLFSNIDERFFQYYGAIPNPKEKVKKWDFIAHSIEFDLKSTRLFNDELTLKDKIINGTATKEDLEYLGNRFYTNQSGYKKKNGRFSINNRLFLIHVSNMSNNIMNPEDQLKLKFTEKAMAIKYFMKLDKISTHIYKDKNSGKEALFSFLFICEDNNGNITWYNA